MTYHHNTTAQPASSECQLQRPGLCWGIKRATNERQVLGTPGGCVRCVVSGAAGEQG